MSIFEESTDNVLTKIVKHFPTLNEKQKEAIVNTEGPLLIIAGPGTGKTLVLVLRTLYVLMSKKAEPSEIILTTFTEKASFELRDRISQIAKKVGYSGHLHELKIGTIHSICNDIITKHIRRTPLKNNYIILDDLTQFFFLFEYFDKIIGPSVDDKYLRKWSSKWGTIKGIIPYFNKITEELVDVSKFANSDNIFLKELASAYLKYISTMFEYNKVDFSNLQKIVLDLLNKEVLRENIKGKIKYIMVDEYQDTNYIQEQIILTLCKPNSNVCVVGDEDQSLYRFRGATVRNILEFNKHFVKCNEISININYRSHPRIISAYNAFMNSINWSDVDSKNSFRFPKNIIENPDVNFLNYPSVFCIWTNNENDEGERFAQMIKYFKDEKVISDYSQVALLLSSVRIDNSKQYLEALERYGIPAFAPRAKAYFENEEIKMMIACYSILFGFHGEHLEKYDKKEYLEDAILSLGKYSESPISGYIQEKVKEIAELKEHKSLDLMVADYFYQLLAYEPFSDCLIDETASRNLAIFSQVINTFQIYYNISLVTSKNKEWVKFYLFNSFFRFLLEGGMDEYEDPNNPIPKGYVQVMTIHQSKGLEFPVIIVGSLDKVFKVQKQVERDLSPFYNREPFEPEERVTEFDRMRHYYVAFSRAEKILVLTTSSIPQPYFSPIWDGLDQWPHVKKEALKAQRFEIKQQFVPKKSFSLSSHINVYETCPKQYLFYKEYEFQPSRAGQILFGSLVHQTIEDIHKAVIDGKKDDINEEKIRNWFEDNYRAYKAAGMRGLAKAPKEGALRHVFNYYYQNQESLTRIVEAEVDVSIEKDDYILLGKIDLLLGKDGKLEILDFKTQPKLGPGDSTLEKYIKQLSLYAHILKERYGKNPERLYIYWTAEEKRKDALMEIPYDENVVQDAGKHFDDVVKEIRAKNFDVKTPPDATRVCKECDFRFYCSSHKIIKYKPK